MIGSLRGTVVDRLPNGEILVDVGGVGYRVVAGASLLSQALADEVFVHVHTHVREGAIDLYGFADREERSTFEALITSHGVGPSLAMSILAVHRPRELARIVASEDVDALLMVPGVGRKTAARLLLELRARLDLLEDGAVPPAPDVQSGALAEVRAALDGLGYGADEVRAALRQLPAEGQADELLRAALRELAVAGT